MIVHRYSQKSVVADYGRAVVGMALTYGSIVFTDGSSVVVYILGGLGTLFLVFGVRTALRHMTCVEVSASEIRVTGLTGTVLRWRDLHALKLAYYSTRRDRQGGWMQLKLNGAGCTVRLDSAIEGFGQIVRQALAAARANRLALGQPTLANLAALGLISSESAEMSDG